MSPEQFKKEQAALHEPSATEGRFMFPEQFKKEQAASHEPPVGAPPFVSAWVVEGWLGTLRSRRLGVEDPTRFNAEAQRTQRFMVREQVRKEHGTLHEPSATEGRFMFPEQFKKEQAAPHEPAWERGVYAASASPAQGKLKRRERRAPVKGLAARQQNPVLISGGTNVPAGGSSYFGDPR